MSDPSNWQSLYAGGLGLRLACTTASGNTAIPGAGIVSQMILTNMGNVTVFIKVGSDSSVTATTSCYPLFPSNQVVLPMANYVAAIAESSTADLLINTGNGATS